MKVHAQRGSAKHLVHSVDLHSVGVHTVVVRGVNEPGVGVQNI
jgi:hypothetical protein